jgi:hypothetical protein
VIDQLKKVKWIKLLPVVDWTFMVHQGGKIEIKNEIPLNTREDLSMEQPR